GGIGNIRCRLLEGSGRVAVLPRYFVEKDLAAKRLVRLLPRVRLRSDSFRLVWRSGHPRTAELLALAEELRRLPLQCSVTDRRSSGSRRWAARCFGESRRGSHRRARTRAN